MTVALLEYIIRLIFQRFFICFHLIFNSQNPDIVILLVCVSCEKARRFVGIFPYFQNRRFRRPNLSTDMDRKFPFSSILIIEITALPAYN